MPATARRGGMIGRSPRDGTVGRFDGPGGCTKAELTTPSHPSLSVRRASGTAFVQRSCRCPALGVTERINIATSRFFND